MASKTICDLCGRTIAYPQGHTTLKVSEEYYTDDGDYDLHDTCWKRIKAMFKTKG